MPEVNKQTTYTFSLEEIENILKAHVKRKENLNVTPNISLSWDITNSYTSQNFRDGESHPARVNKVSVFITGKD